MKDLYLPKKKAELLASRLKQWNLLSSSVKVSSFRNRDKPFRKFFKEESGSAFCIDVLGLMNALDIEYFSSQWRLFIDSSKKSFKAVLLHNRNILPAIPVAYSVTLTEHYDNLKLLLAEIDYKTHLWIICSDQNCCKKYK